MAYADTQSGALILDSSMPKEITLAEGCAKGDLLGYSSGWKRALSTAGGVIQAKAVAAMPGKTGDKVVAYFGKVRMGGRITGMTIGNPLYAAEGTDYGKYTDTAPVTSGDSTKVVGYAIATDEAIIDPNAQLDSVHA